jgi:hypothetical protein
LVGSLFSSLAGSLDFDFHMFVLHTAISFRIGDHHIRPISVTLHHFAIRNRFELFGIF